MYIVRLTAKFTTPHQGLAPTTASLTQAHTTPATTGNGAPIELTTCDICARFTPSSALHADWHTQVTCRCKSLSCYELMLSMIPTRHAGMVHQLPAMGLQLACALASNGMRDSWLVQLARECTPGMRLTKDMAFMPHSWAIQRGNASSSPCNSSFAVCQ